MKNVLKRWLGKDKTINELYDSTPAMVLDKHSMSSVIKTKDKSLALIDVSRETGVHVKLVHGLFAAMAGGDFRRHILTGDPVPHNVDRKAEMVAALRALGTIDTMKILDMYPRHTAIKIIGYMKAL